MLCPLCGGQGYAGLMAFDCQGPGCRNNRSAIVEPCRRLWQVSAAAPVYAGTWARQTRPEDVLQPWTPPIPPCVIDTPEEAKRLFGAGSQIARVAEEFMADPPPYPRGTLDPHTRTPEQKAHDFGLYGGFAGGGKTERMRRQLEGNLSKYLGHALVDDLAGHATPGFAVVTPQTIMNEVRAQVAEWERAGWIDVGQLEEIKRDLVVVRDINYPSRVNIHYSPRPAFEHTFMIKADDLHPEDRALLLSGDDEDDLDIDEDTYPYDSSCVDAPCEDADAIDFGALPTSIMLPPTFVEFDASRAVDFAPSATCPDCAGVGFPLHSSGFLEKCEKCDGCGRLHVPPPVARLKK